MSKVLGFDVSSTTIGYCVLELDDLTKEIKLSHLNYFKPTKNGSIIDRIVDTRNKILSIIDTYKPDYIGIEDLIKFMPKSTATTVIMLTTFNRMVCLSCYDYLGRGPELFNVATIRAGLKIDQARPKKEDMPELVAKHLGIIFPYETNKKGKIKVENYDKADGMAVALYYAFLLVGKVKRKGKKK